MHSAQDVELVRRIAEITDPKSTILALPITQAAVEGGTAWESLLKPTSKALPGGIAPVGEVSPLLYIIDAIRNHADAIVHFLSAASAGFSILDKSISLLDRLQKKSGDTADGAQTPSASPEPSKEGQGAQKAEKPESIDAAAPSEEDVQRLLAHLTAALEKANLGHDEAAKRANDVVKVLLQDPERAKEFIEKLKPKK